MSISYGYTLHSISEGSCLLGFNQLRIYYFTGCNNSIQRRRWHPTPALLPGKSHGQRSLVGCSPWGREESDTTEQLHFHSSLSCIAEGNGNPLQCSCLENTRDRGACWAAVYGVAQSRTRLKRLSSSSSSSNSTCSWFHLWMWNVDTESTCAVPFYVRKWASVDLGTHGVLKPILVDAQGCLYSDDTKETLFLTTFEKLNEHK